MHTQPLQGRLIVNEKRGPWERVCCTIRDRILADVIVTFQENGSRQQLASFHVWKRTGWRPHDFFFKLAIFTDVCIPGWQPCRTVIQSSVNLMFLKKEISHSICKAFLFDFLQEPNCTVATNLSYPQGLAGKFNSVILC